MSESNESGTIVGVFHDRAAAERALEDLQSVGYDENQIGFAGPGSEGDDIDGSDTAEGAATGAVGGGVLGGALGALASGLIPGVGPIIAVGALTGILGGAAAGGAAGGIAGALVGMGVSEDDAKYYEEELRAGRSIITVRPEESISSDARAILERHGAYDARTRRS
jgi:hypothetical protein